MARPRPASATFRCGDQAVIVTYLGRRRWELSGASCWTGPHEAVAVAIRDALHLAANFSCHTEVIEIAAGGASGSIKNIASPPDFWRVDLTAPSWSWTAGHTGVANAIMACLMALRLAPTSPPASPPEPIDADRFGRPALDGAADPQAWASDLERTLSARLRGAADAESEVNRIVRELKALGHDLWSHDESYDFSIWGYDYVKPRPGARLVIRFAYAAYEDPAVEVDVQHAP